MAPPVVIETERLRFRPLVESDLDAFARVNMDDEVARFLNLGKPITRADTWRAIAVILGHQQMRGFAMWAIELKATGEFVGRGGPWFPEGWPMLEVGWLVDARLRGQGIATELGRVAVDWCFANLQADAVCSIIRPDNLASARVAEKLGAKKERHLAEFYGSPADLWVHRPR